MEWNELRRPYRLKKRNIQEGEQKEELLYEEKDPEKYLSVIISKDKKYILV